MVQLYGCDCRVAGSDQMTPDEVGLDELLSCDKHDCDFGLACKNRVDCVNERLKRHQMYPDGNPKDTIGATKLPLDLVPDSAVAYMALAFLEGASKYGQFNWRIAGVRFSVYDAAMQRHRAKLRAGEWADSKTKIPHLASMMACCAIILDAELCGKLIDDRPPEALALPGRIDAMVADVAHVKKTFASYHPKQFTIKDTK